MYYLRTSPIKRLNGKSVDVKYTSGLLYCKWKVTYEPQDSSPIYVDFCRTIGTLKYEDMERIQKEWTDLKT